MGAKKFVLADDRLAARQMYAAMSAAHHVPAILGARRLILPDAAAITFEKAVNDPGAQDKKYQLNQHHPAPFETKIPTLWTRVGSRKTDRTEFLLPRCPSCKKTALTG
jgi:hypothetical protein